MLVVEMGQSDCLYMSYVLTLGFHSCQSRCQRSGVMTLDGGGLGSSTRVTCKMVSDGGGRFVPAGIVGLHTLSLLLSSRVAHDCATEDNHTQEGNQEQTQTNTTEHYSWVQYISLDRGLRTPVSNTWTLISTPTQMKRLWNRMRTSPSMTYYAVSC